MKNVRLLNWFPKHPDTKHIDHSRRLRGGGEMKELEAPW